MSGDEKLALMSVLNHHIPNHLRSNAIKTEFKLFYQGLLKNIEHLPENIMSKIKTTLGRTCEIYSKIRKVYQSML